MALVAIWALGANRALPYNLGWLILGATFVAASFLAWKREHKTSRTPLTQRPALVGKITSVDSLHISPTDTRCRIRIHAWIRNDGRVETGARVAVAINDTHGKPLFISGILDQSLGLELLTRRLKYGRRAAGFLAFDVETLMANVDGKTATVTLFDDFDKNTVLRY
jgi:hypothetical protein